MRLRSWSTLVGVCRVSVVAMAVERCVAMDSTVDLQFERTVRPFLAEHCLACHSRENAEAKLDLSVFRSIGDVAKDLATWQHVVTRLSAGEMPPAETDKQPSSSARQAIVTWIRDFRRQEALRLAGDPGIVLTRRLSNAEYNYSIRDITGVDIHPTNDFPVDPANEAGFDNSGESLSMSPALLKKYLEAARFVSEHAVLKPNGITFAPHPVVTDTDRDKYCVKRIVQFYQRQPTDLAKYFRAAWQVRELYHSLPREKAIEKAAAESGVSDKYLAKVWAILTDSENTIGPIAQLQSMWKQLPTGASNQEAANPHCEAMRTFVFTVRRKLEPKLDNLDVKGIHKGSQAFVLWKNNQYARFRRSFDPKVLSSASETEPCLQVPDSLELQAAFEANLARFCNVFPDTFYVSERGRDYDGKPREQQEKGRLLSAGFHSMMGYYRDDAPLCDLILTESQKHELDELWRELDFVTGAPTRQYTGFVWFERTDSAYMRDVEFDFARAEDKSVTDESMIERLRDAYLSKAKTRTNNSIPLQAIQDYFDGVNRQIRWVEQARLSAEPSHLEALIEIAAAAWRRELSASEREHIIHFYRSLRQSQGLSHEDAIQDSLVAIWMSPYFCYRTDYAQAGVARRELSDIELASRLSYFLWSSVPDKHLRDLATSGSLKQPDVLKSEARRMLLDPRTRSLATEFAGNWLDFRRFEEHNAVDRSRFPQFTEELRQAMYEEPIQFFLDVVKQDRSVLEFLHGNHTLVNEVLAKHYGMSSVRASSSSPNDWILVGNANDFGRGGLLPMSVFMTKNAPGLRTSPVKRGYWVVKRLLGETIPAPPPNVPELPADESQLGDKSLRETLAAHREHVACAGCHNRIDSVGLVFEGYGPIGEMRERDLGGRSVEVAAEFPDGSRGQGVAGLRQYLKQKRQNDFLENLCRKLLGFGLGRSLLISDDPLIEDMQFRCASNGYRFSELFEAIITSPQFREKRGDSQPSVSPAELP
ncbi:MAG: DUF1592 domain-containing protein [Pirellula sp.]